MVRKNSERSDGANWLSQRPLGDKVSLRDGSPPKCFRYQLRRARSRDATTLDSAFAAIVQGAMTIRMSCLALVGRLLRVACLNLSGD